MSNLDAIFGKAVGTAIDPVCKMTVDKAKPGGGTAEHEGEIYYFCGSGCNAAFAADPYKYLDAEGAAESHASHDYEGLHHMEHSAAGMDIAVCYPCNHSVDKATTPHWDYKDTTFYFCSTGCEEKVKAEPERWLVIANSKVTLEPKSHGHDHHGH